MYYYFYFIVFLQNELAILEFIHNLVETLDRYFSSVVSVITFYLLLFNPFTILPYMDIRTCKKKTSKKEPEKQSALALFTDVANEHFGLIFLESDVNSRKIAPEMFFPELNVTSKNSALNLRSVLYA